MVEIITSLVKTSTALRALEATRHPPGREPAQQAALQCQASPCTGASGIATGRHGVVGLSRGNECGRVLPQRIRHSRIGCRFSWGHLITCWALNLVNVIPGSLATNNRTIIKICHAISSCATEGYSERGIHLLIVL